MKPMLPYQRQQVGAKIVLETITGVLYIDRDGPLWIRDILIP